MKSVKMQVFIVYIHINEIIASLKLFFFCDENVCVCLILLLNNVDFTKLFVYFLKLLSFPEAYFCILFPVKVVFLFFGICSYVLWIFFCISYHNCHELLIWLFMYILMSYQLFSFFGLIDVGCVYNEYYENTFFLFSNPILWKYREKKIKKIKSEIQNKEKVR